MTRPILQNELLLIPEQLLKEEPPFSILEIDRSERVPKFKMMDLTDETAGKYFSIWDVFAMERLRKLTREGFAFEIGQLKKQHQKSKSGISMERFMEKAVPRYLLSSSEALLSGISEQCIYHRVKHPKTGNYLIAKSGISNIRPQLSFELFRNGAQELGIKTIVHIEEATHDLKDFQVFSFLLLKDDTYHLLDNEAQRTLNWLSSGIVEQWQHNDAQFLERIVKKIESRYELKKEGVFRQNEISSAPTNSLYLSELSDTMLMLTPRWNYEGILVDLPFQALHDTVRQGVSYVIRRDQAAEQGFTDLLRSLHPNFEKQNNFHYLSFADAKKKQWFLKTYQQLLADGVDIIGMELLRHFRYSPHVPETVFSISEESGKHIKATMTLHFGQERVKLSEVQKMLLTDQNTILLKDNTIAVFPDEWMAEYARILKHAKIRNEELVVSKFLAFGLQESAARDKLLLSVPADWREKWLRWQQEEDPVYPLPAMLKASLRPYQQKGFEWLVLLAEIGAGACLADDMGLGKTLQTIAFICRTLEQDPAARILITCPMTLTFNWQDELRKFAPSIEVLNYNGTQRDISSFLAGNARVLIASYGTMRNDVERLSVIEWDLVVADESQNVKNAYAYTTRALMQLQAAMRIALTGTPILNNTTELYAQMDLLVPGLLGNIEFFKKEYAQPIDKYANEQKMQQLQQIVTPFLLKRNKQQVATDLPSKTESIIWCQMDERQQILYDAIRSQVGESIFLDIRNNGMGGNKLNILQAILKLRQVCASPQLLNEYGEETSSVKLKVLLEQFEKLKDKKILVFSQFKGMLHLVAKACKTKGLAYFHFDGDTPLPQRKTMVENFQDPKDDTNIFLISLKAGNAGLNLTAAEYVFLIDPWWNHAVQQQAIDRTHRIGQTKNIFAYQMLCKDTIEEKMVHLQQKKADISNELVRAEEHFVKNLTEDDVKYLFS